MKTNEINFRFMEKIHEIANIGLRESIFVLEALKGRLDNKYIESYMLLMADNHFFCDIRAILNKHEREVLKLDDRPLRFDIIVSIGVVRAMLDLFRNDDDLSDTLRENSKIKKYFEMDLIDFYYPEGVINEDDHKS